MTVLRFDDNRGDLAYPFLPAELNWQIVSRPFNDENAAAQIFQAPSPTLRWVKDNKVLDLYAGMDTQTFLAHSGLQLSMAKGGYVLSKRLSRIIRPFRYWHFFNEADITIDYNPQLDSRLWDGCGQVSRGFIQQLADKLDLDARHRRELLQCNRFEVTTLHAQGQDKGHVLVVDDLAVDFMFPAATAKQELALVDGRVFIGLHPVHSEDQLCLDVQSIINLYPFFQPEQLLAWAHMEGEMFLNGIGNGRLESILNRLYDAESVSDLDALSNWHVGEYIASGGRVMWFAGMVKAVAKQHLNRLGSRASKLRCPVPGGRYYIFPSAVGDRQVPQGHVELDPTCATAWVNDSDWLTFIVEVLGGCDGDDAVWVFPFIDSSDGKKGKVMIWRSPNQLGEYVILQPTATSHSCQWQTAVGSISAPQMKSRLLPNRIDSVNYQYGRLMEASDPTAETSYSIAGMASTIQRAMANQGVLGGFCNVAMMCKAIYGRLPHHLPATLEAVIDGSVKSGLDLTPVKEWNQMAMTRIVQHGRNQAGRAMPTVLLERLPEWLRQQAQPALHHWLDTLVNALEQYKEQYWADVEALATEACPPIELFDHGREWMVIGKALRQAYGRAVRLAAADVDADNFEAARMASETFLRQWPTDKQPLILLGAAAHIYAQGPQHGEPVRDSLIWQLGGPRAEGGRDPGIAHQMLAGLRHIGLLGQPMWTAVGAVLYYQEESDAYSAGVPIRLNGVWLNWLNAQNGRRYSHMSQVPPVEREQAKAHLADIVQSQIQGMMLSTEVTENDRVLTRTPRGNLFGYVQPDHELVAIRHAQWRIAWAHVVDGNVHAILERP